MKDDNQYRAGAAALLAGTVALAMLASATSQAQTCEPLEFNEKIHLSGSTIYNAVSPFAAQELDWLVDTNSTAFASIVMGDGESGLVYAPGTTSGGGTWVTHQLIQPFQVEDGIGTVSLRIAVSDVTKIGFRIGLWDRSDDPLTDNPPGVFFEKPDNDDDVDLVMHDGVGSETVEEDKFSVSNALEYDVVVSLNGNGANNTVVFAWRSAGGSWTSTTITDEDLGGGEGHKLPQDSDELLFSVVVFTDVSGGTSTDTMTASLFKFEADK